MMRTDEGLAGLARAAAERRRGALQEAMRNDQARAAGAGGGRLRGSSGRHTMQASVEAVMNAVDTEGPEVLSEAGRGYWADMRRRHPWIDRDGGVYTPVLPSVRSRFGRVTERVVYGKDGDKRTLVRGGAAA